MFTMFAFIPTLVLFGAHFNIEPTSMAYLTNYLQIFHKFFCCIPLSKNCFYRTAIMIQSSFAIAAAVPTVWHKKVLSTIC